MIRGYFNVDSNRPQLSVALFLPGISPRWAMVEFLIDTGADSTVLAPAAAVDLFDISSDRLSDPSNWPDRIRALGVGGSTLVYRTLARFDFASENGIEHSLSGTILIPRPIPSAVAPPSLLGWDVLRHFRTTFDPCARAIALDPYA